MYYFLILSKNSILNSYLYCKCYTLETYSSTPAVVEVCSTSLDEGDTAQLQTFLHVSICFFVSITQYFAKRFDI